MLIKDVMIENSLILLVLVVSSAEIIPPGLYLKYHLLRAFLTIP